MALIKLLESFNFFLAVLMTLIYFYQLGYLAVGLIWRKRWNIPQAQSLQH